MDGADAEQWCEEYGGIKYFEVRAPPLAAGACVVAHRAAACLQVSAKDATNVDPAFGHVALAAFEHFKEIKALQEQELMKGAASARIDLGAADDQPAGQESTCC